MQRILGFFLAVGCLLAGLFPAAPARAEIDDSADILTAILAPQETSLPQISARRTLRLGVPNSAIFFWYDGDKLVGLGVDIARELERYLSQTREAAIDVIVTPLPRGELLLAVGEGRIDLALARFSSADTAPQDVRFTNPLFDRPDEVDSSRPAPRPTLPDISIIAEGGPAIRWALRGDAPALLRSAVAFSTEIARGSLIGNLLAAQYIDVPGGEETIRARADLSRLQDTLPLIQRHAGRYDVDWRLVLALAYQESKLDQSRQSQAGAVGIMQVLPTTAADPNVGIGDISEPDANIQAGIKYLAFLKARYFSDPAIAPADRIYLTLAAYNAGPGAVLRAQKRAAEKGLDPNAWFGNVEIALAETVSREPVTYVRNIRKYFVGLTLADASGAVAQWGAPTGFGRIVALVRIWWPLAVAYLSLLAIAAIGLRWRGAFVRARRRRRGAA